MNFFITILLCVFISVITEAAVFPSNDVAGLKNKIIAAANDLTHYNNTYKSNFESLLNKLKIKYINDLHNTIDFIRNETNQIIFSDNNEYNAEDCYERVNERLDEDSEQAINSLDECTHGKFIVLNLIQHAITHHIINSNQILSRFDSIVNCTTGIFLESELCDAQKISAINYEVEQYPISAKQLKNMGDQFVKKELTNITTCFKEIIIDLSSDVKLSKYLAILCSSNIFVNFY
ncbi:uncharacterized protein LOC103579441 isoform X1 [Microplitis demolitor]|uniref:uncharacterized protein LOC103579441 isoform X1 n=1 Tax=Microplitis demolitor TaxID=69319 RepID=UPI0004CCAE7B|nr:uncharacterized protein LOC103579441 isoform X1 [Microplitis demolitor]